MDAVTSVHVKMSWRSEHGGITRGWTSISVRGWIVTAHVGLGLHDHARQKMTIKPPHQ